ncbi:hypothetical protein [Arvimicrobium flavum]|uniref:hypothetical protein n=1 Tax=Arvimicrobium flavum TaxID=3393320 RepID=UPI00237C174D|nr:hypothetical protein [Mesorhizobium shangrilense]
MAHPARRFDEATEGAPSAVDPLNPAPPATDPATDPRYRAANDPRVDNSTVVQSRSPGSGVLIAALVIVLAVIAYFLFAPGAPETSVPVDQPATTSEPATPAPDTMAPAPDATAPAAPATPAAPAPDATAPASPETPAAPAPESSAPAPTTPAPTEPAPAPAQ